MTSRAELALRRQALVERAGSQRRRAQILALNVGEGLRVPRVAGTVLGSPQGRRIAVGLALMVLKGGRLGRLLRLALGAVALVKVARMVGAHPPRNSRPTSGFSRSSAPVPASASSPDTST
jgi:hypothetical protein